MCKITRTIFHWLSNNSRFLQKQIVTWKQLNWSLLRQFYLTLNTCKDFQIEISLESFTVTSLFDYFTPDWPIISLALKGPDLRAGNDGFPHVGKE